MSINNRGLGLVAWVVALLVTPAVPASAATAAVRGPVTGCAVPSPALARAAGPAAGARAGRLAPAAQVTRSERADLTFELRPGTAGTVELRARRGDLTVRKTVQPTGEFALELSDGREAVTLSLTAKGARVVRGRTVVTLDGEDDRGDEVKMRRLLAESSAVVQFRAAVAALLEADDRSAPATALLIADAVVGALAGDVDAPRRTARHLGARGRGPVRPVGMAVDCFTTMEQRMTEAWYDYQQCWISTSYNVFYQNICGYRWVLQVESYWFSFISCSGLNW